MVSVLKRLTSSLEVRLIVPMAATVALVGAIHAFVGYWNIRDQVSRFVLSDVERSTALIRNVTHDGMLLNRMSELQSRLERVGSSPGFAAVRVYSTDGRVALSADRSEIDRVVPLDSSTCAACHVGGVPKGDAVLRHRNLLERVEGAEVRRCVSVIPNEPACSAVGCHTSVEESPVLGVLDVQMSMAPFDTAIAASRRQLILTTTLLVIAGGLVVAFCVRHFVHRPVGRLHEGTRRIASGDLASRIDVPGHHELADLARAFNSMAADLSSARDQLAEWSRTLERRVEEKTAELTEAQKHLTRMETMSSLGKLSATVAHELNNPLSGILTYARLVRRELSDQSMDASLKADLDRYLLLIDQETTRCGGIVKNLLVFARGSSVRLASTDLNQIVERCLMLVRHHLEINNISLESHLSPEHATLVADQGQLHQAILAVLMNAVEAIIAARGPQPTLRIEVQGDPELVTVTVSDSGVGIPDDVLPHIFEPFFTTKGESSGVGLGLSVVYGVVHTHGGTICVHSKPGTGTTFTMTFPRQRPGAAVTEVKPMEVSR